ncbi:MAG: protein-glutamate O-methyltransferase CheR [Pseudomonadota bacterium]
MTMATDFAASERGASGSAGTIVPGVSPQLYSRADFDRIAKLVHDEAGIVLSDRKAMLAYSRIAPLVRESAATRFGEFLDRLAQDSALKTRVISALTTNHTYFNREPHHYDHFATHVRPGLVARASAGEPIRLWSAGCSSGEEIWTLMMFLLGTNPSEGVRLSKSNIIALASDLAGHAVTAAQAGIYPTDALKAVPEALRKAWCDHTKEGGQDMLSIGQAARSLVRFRQLNLLRSWPFRQSFDVIFCRNVMIYFDEPTKEKLVLRLAEQLRPGGTLYIGHSERVFGPATALIEPDGPTVYRRKAGGRA